jgi:hypothetical protein
MTLFGQFFCAKVAQAEVSKLQFSTTCEESLAKAETTTRFYVKRGP